MDPSGVRPGDVVALLLPSGIEFAVAYARYLEIACSQRCGFCKNATGEISTFHCPM